MDVASEETQNSTSSGISVHEQNNSCNSSSGVISIKDRTILLKRADCKRASRAGIARPPSLDARLRAREAIQAKEEEFLNQKRTLLTQKYEKTSRAGSTGSYKTNHRFSILHNGTAKLTHLQSLKSRTVDQFNTEPGYLLCDRTAELQYDRLAESALRANAGSQAVTKRRATQGASNQTPRINSRSIGMAAAVQTANASITIALSEAQMREAGLKTFDPMGATAINFPKLCFASSAQRTHLLSDPESTYLPVVSTKELVYNSIPCKLGTSCIRSAAQELARRELSENVISRAMYADPMITSICKSIGGGYEIDAIWASVVLVVFLSYDPRGRRVLAQSKLTDMDLQTAFVLECYGRAEITRRVRLLEQQSLEKSGQSGGKPRGKAKRGRETKEKDSTEEGKEGKEEEDVSGLAPSGVVSTIASLIDIDEDSKALGTKRRRTNKAAGSSSSCDSYCLIDWWFRALRSNQASVLETLIASSRDTAKEAAKTSLKRQACGNDEVASNKKLNGISVSTAVKSCEELVRLVHTHVRDTPMVVCATSKWSQCPLIGILQKPKSVHQFAIYACTLPREELQPHPNANMVVLHASANQEFAPRSIDSVMPCILERYSRLAEIRTDDDERSKSAKGRRILSSIETFIEEETKFPILSVYAGMTRSFVSMQISVPITPSMRKASKLLSEEAIALFKKHSTTASQHQAQLGTSCSISNGSSNGSFIRAPTSVLGTSQADAKRIEPLCTPSSRLGIGLRLNELLRRWMINRTRKNGIAVVVCGLHSMDDIPKDLGLIMDSEPLPLGIMVDFKTYMPPGGVLPSGPSGPSEVEFATIGASLNICVEGAVRVPELVQKTDKLFERRALMLAASSQASYISDVGAALSAQWANCSSASSKKVSCADVNTMTLLSIWDVFAGGLTNVHRNYTNTAYSGVYSSHIDTGITSPGLLAGYYRADKRQHGTVSLGQETADKLCGMISGAHFVPVGDDHYATTPIQTRGIPHGFVPGLHSVLNDYTDSIETYRAISGRSEDPTCDGLFALPFSAWTQALAPDVEATVDLTIRNAFRDPSNASLVSGRSYLPDTTSEDEAIFIEPLWRRPCQVCSLDNPFATSYSYSESMFNACNLISVMVIDIAARAPIALPTEEAQLKYIFEFVCNTVFVTTSEVPDASPSLLWVCDFLVLVFGCIYPSSHAIDEEVVPPELSALASRMATRCKKQERKGQEPVGAPFNTLLSEQSLAKVQKLWAPFSKRPAATCAWRNGLQPLLLLLMKHKGSNAVPRDLTLSMRKAVDDIPRSAWLVYSEDGKTPPAAPNPLSECPSPNHVQRIHLDPIFCAMGKELEVEPRGCLVGLQPFQLRQIYALLMGSHLKNAKPQVVRNEGGLNLRLSSASDILEMDGKERSEKAISPLQVEADSDAFGTREAKLYGSALQRSAWDRNAMLLSHLFARLEPPLEAERRSRGEWGEAAWLGHSIQEERELKQTVHEFQRLAKNQLERAALLGASPEFAWAV